MMENEYVDIVLRTVGERTCDAASRIARMQVGRDVRVVGGDTHEEAIACTYRAASKSSAEWIVAIDADVLLLRDGIARLRTRLAACPVDTGVFYPGVFDKLYRMKRWAGLQVYRRARLDEIVAHFDKVRSQQTLKVEGRTIAEYRRNGGGVVFSHEVFALHDFWQYYRDLYRKGYLNALRNPGYNSRARRLWLKWGRKDADYRVLRAALEQALAERRQLSNSVHDFSREELDATLSALGLDEKPPLDLDDDLLVAIDHAVDEELRSRGRRKIREDFFERRGLAPAVQNKIRTGLARLGLVRRRVPG